MGIGCVVIELQLLDHLRHVIITILNGDAINIGQRVLRLSVLIGCAINEQCAEGMANGMAVRESVDEKLLIVMDVFHRQVYAGPETL